MERDKILHMAAGGVIAVLGTLWLGHPVFGFWLAFAAGMGKEVWDALANRIARRRGNVPQHSTEFEDVLYTAFGAGLGLGALSFIS